MSECISCGHIEEHDIETGVCEYPPCQCTGPVALAPFPVFDDVESVVKRVATRLASVEDAEVIAAALIEGKFAATVTVREVRTWFAWGGDTHTSHEWELEAISSPARVTDTVERIKELHTYDVPAVTVQTLDADESYAAWVKGSCWRSQREMGQSLLLEI